MRIFDAFSRSCHLVVCCRLACSVRVEFLPPGSFSCSGCVFRSVYCGLARGVCAEVLSLGSGWRVSIVWESEEGSAVLKGMHPLAFMSGDGRVLRECGLRACSRWQSRRSSLLFSCASIELCEEILGSAALLSFESHRWRLHEIGQASSQMCKPPRAWERPRVAFSQGRTRLWKMSPEGGRTS